ncbi:MAG: NADH:flavin oxidoreductase/NADH oxidase family protein [Wenzhouxiangellaceae bacterium]
MSVTLASPLELPCGSTLSNRIAKSAMTEGLADAHDHPTPAHDTLYRCWSQGGCGLLISGNVMIDHRYLERPGNVVIEDRSGMPALQRWARAGTEAGNHLWMQISHPGRQCARISTGQPLSPSTVQLHILGNFAKPRAMDETDIERAINGYVNTAEIAREAGFTGVQIHGAHGYLISQFLSPVTNRREDQWGGSLEHRARFLLEVIDRVRARVGSDYPLSVKLNSADFQKGGFTPEESMQVAQWLSQRRIDLLEISGGTYEQTRFMGHQDAAATATDPNVRDSTRRREAYFLEYASAVQTAIDIPLMVTGGFRHRATMIDALEKGELDVIGLARPLCVIPDLPRQLIEGAAETAPAPERDLRLGNGVWGPASSVTALRAINVQGEVAWFYRQIIQFSKGKPPLLRLGIVRAFVGHMLRELRIGIRRRLAQRGRNQG